MRVTIVQKRQPMAFNEFKECCKGHSTLAENICQEPLQRQGKRHVPRIMNDAYGKGIVRGQVETQISAPIAKIMMLHPLNPSTHARL